MTPLFDTTEYRDLIKDYYERRKEEFPLYSYRMMAKKLGLDSSQLFRVLNKQQHLPSRCVPAVKELLELQGRAAEFFDLLVASGRCRNEKKREEILNKAYQLRDVYRSELKEGQLEILSHWYHPVIRAYIEVSQGKAIPTQIAKSLIPAIESKQVEHSLQILSTTGLLKKLPAGRFALANSHITASGPDKAKAVRNFQKQVLELGKRALDEIEVEERDISTLTLAIDEDCFQDLKEMMCEFRRQVQKRIEESKNPDRVVQLNMALFPTAQKKESISS